MDKCISWVKRNRSDVDDAGAYCMGIKQRQEKASKAVDAYNIDPYSLIPLSNEEVGKLAESIVVKDDISLDSAIILYMEMEDRGMNPAAFMTKSVYDEAKRWSESYRGFDRAVSMDDILSHMPNSLTVKDIDVMLIGEAEIRGMVSRNGSIILRINKADRNIMVENEIVAATSCPHVSRKFEFVWGVDPSDQGLTLYKGGELQLTPDKCTCITKAVWDTAYVNDLPDSSFAYVEQGEKDGEGKTVPRSKRHLPYKDKDGKVDAAHVRNALARLNQTNIPAAARESARRKLVAAAKRVGVDVAEKSFDAKYSIDTYSWISVEGKGFNITPVQVSKSIVTIGDDKYNIDNDVAVPDYGKISKTDASGESRINVYRENRRNVITFDTYMLTETAPMSKLYALSRIPPEGSFRFSISKHVWDDITNYQMFIVKGDEVEAYTMKDLPISDGTTFIVDAASDSEMNREGKWRSSGKLVTTTRIDEGYAQPIDKGMIINGKILKGRYEIDHVGGVINNK